MARIEPWPTAISSHMKTSRPTRGRVGIMVSMTIPDLPETPILMVEVGSTAHGTGIAGGEDHDQLAIMVEAPEQVIGLDPAGFRPTGSDVGIEHLLLPLRSDGRLVLDAKHLFDGALNYSRVGAVWKLKHPAIVQLCCDSHGIWFP